MHAPEPAPPALLASAGSGQNTRGALYGVAGCCWLFLLSILGGAGGGWAGWVRSGPVQQGSGEWQGLGALGKLFTIIHDAFFGAAIGAIAGGVVIALYTATRRAKNGRASDGDSQAQIGKNQGGGND